MSTREKREQRKARKARFAAMYPGLSHDEIIEECIKELNHYFEVGPEVALIWCLRPPKSSLPFCKS